ncbi:hypothetical protein BKA67DRAFT_595981 [Truncatella angustata]|uniref:Uncharacterized protein n=1 Tax=Truncatella angustata TaxID=152316 RepID=A0A9P8RFH2_9PEZI|nr:uncharacterized protein BKA67DRAFT_595981 [Truncatella angustata]KAH6645054.1 hypothetical protein BKA67DRAFT_595981 [Truncatella angustata]
MSQNNHSSGPPSVINAGLFKTGSASMAEAYKILGLRPHHGLDITDVPEHWAQLERAAEAKWPDIPGARPHKAFTRSDWDKVFGEYDAITDLGAPFAEELAAAYPDAKVVVVQRDADKWFKSFDQQTVTPTWGARASFNHYVVFPILRFRGVYTIRKILYGQWRAKTPDDIRKNAKREYEAYYARLREVIPPERRLEYKIGDGWVPLCQFLGKEVPNVDFPWVNESAAHSARFFFAQSNHEGFGYFSSQQNNSS